MNGEERAAELPWFVTYVLAYVFFAAGTCVDGPFPHPWVAFLLFCALPLAGFVQAVLSPGLAGALLRLLILPAALGLGSVQADRPLLGFAAFYWVCLPAVVITVIVYLFHHHRSPQRLAIPVPGRARTSVLALVPLLALLHAFNLEPFLRDQISPRDEWCGFMSHARASLFPPVDATVAWSGFTVVTLVSSLWILATLPRRPAVSGANEATTQSTRST